MGIRFVDYKGITVDEDTKLRTELRQNDVEYSVVKNTLTRFALKDVGLEAMSDLLNGTTSLATSTADPIGPIRMIHDMSEKMAKDEKFIVKGAFLEGKVLSDAEIAEIAQLQNKDALYSKVLGTMLAPITGLAVCLNQVVEQMGGAAAPCAMWILQRWSCFTQGWCGRPPAWTVADATIPSAATRIRT